MVPGGTSIGCKFGLQIALLALLVNVTNIWCFLHHQVAPLAIVTNLATRWRHLYYFELWPPSSATCISFKSDHHEGHIGIELLSSSASITSLKSAKGLPVNERAGHLDPIKKQTIPFWTFSTFSISLKKNYRLTEIGHPSNGDWRAHELNCPYGTPP